MKHGFRQVAFGLFVLGIFLSPLQLMAKDLARPLKVALQSSPRTLDPHLATEASSMRVIEPLYNSLMRYSSEYGKVEPDLLKEIQISADKKSYYLTLNRGVMFHHSKRELKAQDVKFSLERILRKKIRAYQFSALKDIEILGPYRIKLQLSRPFAPLLTFLAHPMNAIVDAEALQKGEVDLKSGEAGTGAFQLEEWKKGRFLAMKKFSEYFEKSFPYLDSIKFIPIPDRTARSLALRSGQVDVLLEVSPKELKLLRQDPEIELSTAPGTFWEYVGLNTQVSPFSDPRVRQAIAYALDRNVLNQLIKQGQAQILPGGPIPEYHWVGGGKAVYDAPNLDRAKELLKQAGWPDGFKTTLLVGTDFEDQVDAAQVVKQQLKRVGIQVKIRALESSLFFARLASGDFAMTLVGWVGFVDPDEWLYNLFHSEGIWNQQKYQNEQVDRLLAAARIAPDPNDRKIYYQKAQGIIAREAPMAFLYINPQVSAFRKSIEGLEVHPTASAKILEQVRWQEGEGS